MHITTPTCLRRENSLTGEVLELVQSLTVAEASSQTTARCRRVRTTPRCTSIISRTKMGWSGPVRSRWRFNPAHVILRGRRTQTALFMPRLLQALVIRATVLLGTVLGRYRGTTWPGCPDGCTGAPTAAGNAQAQDAR